MGKTPCRRHGSTQSQHAIAYPFCTDCVFEDLGEAQSRALFIRLHAHLHKTITQEVRVCLALGRRTSSQMETQYLLNRMSDDMVDHARYGAAYYIQSDLSEARGGLKADGLPTSCVN